MTGDVSETTMKYIIRDHDKGLFEEKKKFITKVCEEIEALHEGTKIEVKLTDSYYNMLEKIEPDNMHVVRRCLDAMKAKGIEPIIEPIRGGTDGAILSSRGLPCPNLATGGYNYHSRYEFASIPEMEKSLEVLKYLSRCT